MHTSPEEAIDAACRLIDDGFDVYGIGTGPLADSIARPEILRIHEFWARAKPLPRQGSAYLNKSINAARPPLAR